MNELLFLTHTIVTFGFVLLSLRLGKEWLMTTTILQWVFANLFVLKQIELFGLTATASDAFAVGGSVGIALLNEFFGKQYAKKAVWIGFYALVVFAAMSWIQTTYLPSNFDTKHDAYVSIFTSMPRLLIASFSAYVISELFNVSASSFFKKFLREKHLMLRIVSVAAAAQFIDTVLFSYLGLYGIVSSLSSVILVSFTIKCIALALSIPLVTLVKKYVPIQI